jgi:hypothetical protein
VRAGDSCVDGAAAIGPFIIDESDGTGDGDDENGIWWIGRPVRGGALVAATLEGPAATEKPAAIVDEATGDGSTSDVGRPDGSKAGRPP